MPTMVNHSLLHSDAITNSTMITESTIILAIIGMVGLFSTAIIWQRSNRITSTYYARLSKQHRQVLSQEQEDECRIDSAC